AVVRDLVVDLIGQGVDATVSPLIRTTVEAVSSLLGVRSEVMVVDIAKRLELDKSAASRRRGAAGELGDINNLEDRKGRPFRLVLGDLLPEDIEVLPAPDVLSGGCTVDAEKAGDSQKEEPVDLSDGESLRGEDSAPPLQTPNAMEGGFRRGFPE